MLYYDLQINAWVRKPGSSAPPWMEPVITLGSDYEISIQFCRGPVPVVIASSETWLIGIKVKDDFPGAYIASSTTAVNRGDANTTFNLDLTTSAAAAYFTANPTAGLVACEMQVEFTVASVKTTTARLPLILQNTLLS